MNLPTGAGGCPPKVLQMNLCPPSTVVFTHFRVAFAKTTGDPQNGGLRFGFPLKIHKDASLKKVFDPCCFQAMRMFSVGKGKSGIWRPGPGNIEVWLKKRGPTICRVVPSTNYRGDTEGAWGDSNLAPFPISNLVKVHLGGVLPYPWFLLHPINHALLQVVLAEQHGNVTVALLTWHSWHVSVSCEDGVCRWVSWANSTKVQSVLEWFLNLLGWINPLGNFGQTTFQVPSHRRHLWEGTWKISFF